VIHVIAGIGSDGRSTIVSTTEKIIGTPEGGEIATAHQTSSPDNGVQALLFTTTGMPPVLDFDRPMTGPLLDMQIQQGNTAWMHFELGPRQYEFHRTDTIDYNIILAGEVELLLEETSVLLRAGDSVVIPGVLHGWRSATGWSSSLVMIGLGRESQHHDEPVGDIGHT